MKKIRIALWVLVGAAVLGLAVLLLNRESSPTAGETMFSPVNFSAPFTLTGADGQSFARSELKNKPHAIFFGFTHCPDVCPTTLARMVRLREQIGGERPFEILFVTVDPERDGPAEVGKYAELFNSPVIGLTGSRAEIEQVKKQLGIYSRKVPDESGGAGYSVDHTATVLLFDRNGEFAGTIAPDEQDATAIQKLERITA